MNTRTPEQERLLRDQMGYEIRHFALMHERTQAHEAAKQAKEDQEN